MVSLLVLVNEVGLGSDEPRRRSVRLLKLLVERLALVEFRSQFLTSALAESLFDGPARIPALAAGEAARFDLGLTLGVDGDLDGFQAAPPTRMVSLMEPSGRVCSVTWCPFMRASILAFSTA